MTTITVKRRRDSKRAVAETKPRKPLSAGRVVAWIVLWAFILLTVFPFFWMIRTGLSNGRSLAANSGSFLPADFTWGAFKRVLGFGTVAEAQAEGGSGASINFWLYLRNSFIVSTVATAGQVFFSAMAAYAFSRLEWRGRDKMFALFLTALLVPPIFTALPNFLTIKSLGLLNTLPGIILPSFFMTPFAVYFLRQFFLGIPKEIDEAARLDGASHFLTFRRIILPMSTAPVVTLGILQFIASWNDYFWPLLIGQTESSRVLTVALGVFRSQTPQGTPDWAGLMAATLVAAVPILIIYGIFGRRIVNSIGFSGIK
ncbi:carbohydrate ABC transporter permease [Phycicoccus sp. Soil802]|uniref:carbohydrate ABC transporter permease n=1 Tax=Phycicoccus sp. Soil802 TaxID=1736414 RepID=UPI000702901E|nr:carbohydrate ABC transporter permease [Phycicoccus sp. Soil802]KRF22342.1 sugar ABC transporter permease [Phycicoccus sp. Soil802]